VEVYRVQLTIVDVGIVLVSMLLNTEPQIWPIWNWSGIRSII
jgi:hypothetical protein